MTTENFLLHLSQRICSCTSFVLLQSDPIYAAMPFGYVPVLEVDGRKLSSSGGIARFLAERFGKTLPIVVLLKVGSISPRMHKVQWALKLIRSPACLDH